jgi:membrane protein DedA with SNARE-associated domain
MSIHLAAGQTWRMMSGKWSGPPPLPGVFNSLAGPLDHFGYWAVLLLVMVEDFGIPVPGESVLIVASVYAGAGRLNVVAVGVIGFAAAVLGDNIGFAIGRFGGRATTLRLGRYVRLTEKQLNKAEAFFDSHGAPIITVARFVEVLRQVNGIVAGVSGMRWPRFLAFNALGAALWAGAWVSLGYLAGNHIGRIYHYISEYSWYVLIALAVPLAGYIAWRVLRRRAGKQSRKTEPENRDDGSVRDKDLLFVRTEAWSLSSQISHVGITRRVVDELVAGRAVPARLDGSAAGEVPRGVGRIGVPGPPVREQPQCPGEFGALGG